MKLLYKNQTDSLDDDVFQNPPSAYRGAPFWAWNTALDKDVLSKQIRNETGYKECENNCEQKGDETDQGFVHTANKTVNRTDHNKEEKQTK